MKILIATGVFPPDIGGPATYSRLLADELPKKGITVDVVSFGTVRRLPKLIRHIVYGLKLLWHGRASDVVFAQDVGSVGLPAMIAAFILGKVFMVRVPGDYAWEQSKRFGVSDTMEDFQHRRYGFRLELLRKVQRFIVDQADHVIAPSRHFAEVVRGWAKEPAKVSAIYNGIDLAAVRDTVAGISPKPKTIISAGRLVPGKGFEAIVRAMKRLDGWKLTIVGDGPEMPKLRELIAAQDLGDRVSLAGRLERPELLKRLAGSEVFVLNTYFESFSYQIVEAMAVGTPVITTKVGDLPEIVDEGRSGLFMAVDDEEQFASAVRRLSADAALRMGLIEEGRKKAALFSIDATVTAVESRLSAILAASSPLRQKKAAAAKILRYLFSGGTAAATDLILLFVFTDLFGMWYVLSSILAFLVAFVVSFTLQKFFTFQDHDMDGVHGQAFLYFLVTAGNLVINTLFIYALVHYAGLHYLLSQVITSIAIAIESFIIYRMFIFAPSSNKS